MAVDFSVSRDFNHNSSRNPGFLFEIKFELLGLGNSVKLNELQKCKG